MAIDIKNHNPDSLYLKSLIERAGVGQREAARLCGIDERTLRRYIANPDKKSYLPCPYVVQYALENLK